jgi:hypothetical protein
MRDQIGAHPSKSRSPPRNNKKQHFNDFLAAPSKPSRNLLLEKWKEKKGGADGYSK